MKIFEQERSMAPSLLYNNYAAVWRGRPGTGIRQGGCYGARAASVGMAWKLRRKNSSPGWSVLHAKLFAASVPFHSCLPRLEPVLVQSQSWLLLLLVSHSERPSLNDLNSSTLLFPVRAPPSHPLLTTVYDQTLVVLF